MSATVTNHAYSSGKPFHMVRCDPCLVVLNSGHHYPPHAIEYAQRLADEHNAIKHAGVE